MGQESYMLETALAQAETSDFGAILNYGGVDYPCCPGSLGYGGRFVSGGISPNAELIITLRKSLFPVLPTFKTGQPATVTWNNGLSKAVKIASEGVRDCIYAYELTCNDLNEGA